MEKTAVRQRDWTLISLVAAIAVLASTITVAFVRTSQFTRSENALNGIYQKAFYEICEYTESMAVNLSKLSVAGGSARETILSDIIRQAQGAQANLAVLPLGSANTSSTMKYINQAGDYCDTLLTRLARGAVMTDDDYATVNQLSETAAKLSVGLGALLERYDAGDVALMGETLDTDNMSPITDPSAEYPALLYDGPFSDGAQGGDFKALKGLKTVDQAEAQRLLTEFVGVDAVTEINFESESDLDTPCYEFSLTAGGVGMSAAVTKNGGQVLYLLSDTSVTNQVLSLSECFQKAGEFLVSRGYSGMEMSYYSRYEGILTINYAPVQNGVTMYPDLVKIQMSMESGAVIGVEAGNYLRNHYERALEIPAITEEDVRARISARLNVESVSLCVIPINNSEKLCYEISASTNGGTYLIYMDAVSGDEIEIMQVVGDSTGTLVM